MHLYVYNSIHNLKQKLVIKRIKNINGGAVIKNSIAKAESEDQLIERNPEYLKHFAAPEFSNIYSAFKEKEKTMVLAKYYRENRVR